MNKSHATYLNRRHFGCTTLQLIVAFLVLLSGVGCGNQLSQQEKNQSKSPVPTAIEETSENGDRIIYNQFMDGKKNGPWRAYYQNGELKSEGTYLADLKEGVHREWQKDGILSLEGHYSKGKANGLMKWYHEKGHLAGEGNMLDDIRVGKWIICDVEENGFCIEAHFKDGKKDGVWKINHENAEDKLWKEQTWKDDKIVSEKCWDENGQEIACE